MSDWLKDDVNRIHAKLDKLDDNLSKLVVESAKNTKTLEVHEQRSTTNEQDLKLLRKEFNPIKNHVLIVNAIFKIGAALVAVASSIFLILEYFKS